MPDAGRKSIFTSGSVEGGLCRRYLVTRPVLQYNPAHLGLWFFILVVRFTLKIFHIAIHGLSLPTWDLLRSTFTMLFQQKSNLFIPAVKVRSGRSRRIKKI
jgi:hypothetical protein